jgi:carboxyl-terminal processing protease
MESTGEQEKKINRLSNFLLLLALIILIFGSGYRFGQYRSQAVGLSETGANAITVTPSNVDLGLFWKVWNNLKIKYVDQSKVKQQDMIYGAIKGMVASIGDPYTYFLTPKENQSSKDDLGGLYEGIGAQLGMKEGIIIVVAPLKNSPAERAGIKAGDIILAINGESTKGMSLTTAVSKIRGQKNTDAKLKIFRDQKEEIELAIKREAIKVDSVELSYKKAADCQNNCPEVAYIKVSQFGDTSNSEWDIAVKQVAKLWQKKEIRGLVLDLRSNPGGYLESAVYLASEFLPAGKLVVRRKER